MGMPLPNTIAVLLNTLLPLPSVIRKTTLEGHRWTSSELLANSLIEFVASPSSSEVIKKAHELAESKADLAKTGVWGLIKKELYRDSIVRSTAEDVRFVLAKEAGWVFGLKQKL